MEKVKQQTAVQWLEKQLKGGKLNNLYAIEELIEQAIKMERNQMRKSFNAGWYDRDDRGSILDDGHEYFIEYFTDTYQTEP